MDTNSRKLKIYYPTPDRERAKTNRETYKGFLLEYMESHLQPSQRDNSKYHYNCPYCNSGEGKHKTGALYFDTRNPNNNRYYCFACKAKGDIYDLMQQVDPAQAPDAIGAYLLAERLYRGKEPGKAVIASAPPTAQEGQETAQEPTQKTETAWDREFAIGLSCPAWESKEGRTYLTGRGFTAETVRAAKLTHDTDKGRSVIMIPYDGGGEYFYNSRNITPGAAVRYYKHGKQTKLYRQEALYTPGKGYIFVTEGEFDALSITQAGGQAIATGSTSNADLLIRVLEGQPTQKHLILCFDKDKAGQEALSKAAAGLTIQGTAFSIYHIGEPYQDANALLASDGGQERLKEQIKRAIEHAQQPQTTPIQNNPTQDTNATHIQNTDTQPGGMKTPSADKPNPDNIKDYLDQAFDNENKEHQQYKGLNTGLKSLDTAIGDSIYPDLYVIGAIPGIGKTTLMLQLAATFAKQDKHILFFSLEQSKRALVSKGISREAKLTGLPNPPQAKQIKKGDTSAAGKQGREKYYQYAEKLNIIDCNFNASIDYIIEYAKSYMVSNNTKPIIFIDYLQALASPAQSHNTGIRETIDYNIKGLKAFQEINGLIVFLVSSFNRDNYTVTADYTSFKESGGIDYTGSVIWAMQLARLTDSDYMKIPASNITAKREDIAKEMAKAQRRVTITCIKNRDGDTFTSNLIFNKVHDLFTDPPQNNTHI